jgi:hypothetical protein
MGPRTAIHIELTAEERAELERRARAQSLAHRCVVRAQLILALADGSSLSQVARQVGRARRIVRRWARAFVDKRLPGLDDAARSGRPLTFPPGSARTPGQARLRVATRRTAIPVVVDMRRAGPHAGTR